MKLHRVASATHLLYRNRDFRRAEEKPKYYNSEFRRDDTQRHDLGDCTVMCPYCHAYMWKDELPAQGSVLNPSFEVCCKHGKIKMLRSPQPFPTLLRNLYLGQDPRSQEFLSNISKLQRRVGFHVLRAQNRWPSREQSSVFPRQYARAGCPPYRIDANGRPR
jgi:hypothetical protein